MLQDICSHERQFLLTGDFNARPASTEIRMITECKSRCITDLTASLDGTFHDYGRRTGENSPKIDYIFASDEFSLLSVKKIDDTPASGVYYSDHYAVIADVEI